MREVLGSVEEIAEKSPKAIIEEMVRGVRKSVIDSLRGERAHAKMAHEWNAATVKADYARVGISIPDEEAEEISSSINDYTGHHYTEMRHAFQKQAQGLPLTEYETRKLEHYKQVTEYTKVAPVYHGETKILHRGVKGGGEYAKKLRALVAGDDFDLEMASSFSSSENVAKNFAGHSGIILHIEENSWKNAPSARGFSNFFGESEVLVGDQMWKVTRVQDDASGLRHISIVRKRE